MLVLEGLNEAQKRAVLHVEGPALVVAGAGSGKTRVVTSRIAHLLSLGIPASEILAVTFTNKAAGEMARRVERLSSHFVLTCTFHSLGARILRESIHHLGYRSDFTIYDEEDSEKLLKESLVGADKELLKAAQHAIGAAKNDFVLPDEMTRHDPEIGAIYARYQQKLKAANGVDFDDLLFLPVMLLHEKPDVLAAYQARWSFILIDEYQDTNAAQHLLIKLLAKHHNVFAVGDPDQSIYSWRGAKVGNILNFERDFPGATIIPLEQNYRSTESILNAANGLIQHNALRHEKNLWSALGSGSKPALYSAESDRQEAEFVGRKILHHVTYTPLTECAIFYRTNFQSRIFEDTLLKMKIPYIIVGGVSFYERKEIKDILAYLRVAIAGLDPIAFARTINLPKRGLGDKAIQKLRDSAEAQRLPLLDYCTLLVDRKIEASFSPKQMHGLREYVTLILALQEMVRQKVPLETIVSETVERSRYLELLKEDPLTFAERRDNIRELITKAAEWEEETAGSLASFLEELTLKTSSETQETASDAVRLMTIHSSKGLEFSVVFVVGMEEDLFPHMNSRDDPAALEEERRLCYVAMTRAKAHLYLTHARFRFLWGGGRAMRASRFLSEIPSEYTEDFSPISREEASPTTLAINDTVFHRDFGSGVIRRVHETELGLAYDIFFWKTSRVHTLIAKFAKLIKGVGESPD